MLVYTPKGNVPVVGDYFFQCGLLLDHPTPPFSYNDIVSSKTPYLNPHNPPPGGHNRVQYAPNRTVYPPGGNGRWTTATPAGKSVEVQRSQVDELFKNMKSGVELAEMEAGMQFSAFSFNEFLFSFITSSRGCYTAIPPPEESPNVSYGTRERSQDS